MRNEMLNFKEIKYSANGKWLSILVGLGVPDESLSGKHTACPGCGGVDRFRYDDNKERFYCGGGGDLKTGDGFDLLCHVNGYEISEAFKDVADFLGINPDCSPEAKEKAIKYAKLAQTSKNEKELWREMHVLSQILFARSNDKGYPKEHWEREIEAARKIFFLLKALYGKNN